MRIWYLSGSVIPSRSANSVHVMKMAESLSVTGHETTLYAWTGDDVGDPFPYYGVKRCFGLKRAARWRVPGGGTLPYVVRVRADLVGSRAPDLIYGRNLRGLVWATRRGVPLMLEAHNPPGSGRDVALLRRLIRRDDFLGLVVISKALASEYEGREPALRGRILVVPDGADPPRTDRHRGDDAPWRRPGRLQIGYVGQLYPGKGVEMVVQLAAECPHIDFHVVGGSPDQIDGWVAEVRRSGGSASNITFHGHVPHGDLARYFAGCDVFVAPYQPIVRDVAGDKDLARWMSPLKIFEYMATGKPIVCSDLPVLREVLEDGRDALLVPPTDTEAWVRALDRLDESAELRARLGETAMRRLEASFTWDRRARRIAGFAAGLMTT